MHNEDEFPNPMKFEPERFLNPDGSLNDHIRDPAAAVFGFGRRRA
jgi:cytochrome P450